MTRAKLIFTSILPRLVDHRDSEFKVCKVNAELKKLCRRYTNSQIITSNITNFNNEMYIHVYPVKRKTYWLVSRFIQRMTRAKLIFTSILPRLVDHRDSEFKVCKVNAELKKLCRRTHLLYCKNLHNRIK
jgi:hypothetical protein